MRNADSKFAGKLVRPETNGEISAVKSDIITCNFSKKSEFRNPKSKIEVEAYLNGTSQESTPDDARLPARRAYSSERRTAICVIAAGDSLSSRARWRGLKMREG
jgi:hypothetical protein